MLVRGVRPTGNYGMKRESTHEHSRKRMRPRHTKHLGNVAKAIRADPLIHRNTHSPPTNVQIEAPTPLPPPQIKILRRSNQSPSSLGGAGGATGNKASPSPKTYAEKEEEYRLARERIFGKAGTAVAAVGSGSSGTGQETEGGYTSKTASPGSGSRGNSPQPQPVPHQIPSSQFGGMRRSPAGSPASSQHGVLRQPRGPSGGGGFGQAPNPGALPPGW